jgi:hypothetical protein
MRTTLISAVAAALLCDWQAFAQTSARATGVLADSSGAFVPGAELVVTTLDFRERQGTLASVNTVPTLAECPPRGLPGGALDFGPFLVSPAPGTASSAIRVPCPGNVPAARFYAVTSRLIQAYPLPDHRFSDQAGPPERESVLPSANESLVGDSVQWLWIGGRL